MIKDVEIDYLKDKIRELNLEILQQKNLASQAKAELFEFKYGIQKIVKQLREKCDEEKHDDIKYNNGNNYIKIIGYYKYLNMLDEKISQLEKNTNNKQQ